MDNLSSNTLQKGICFREMISNVINNITEWADIQESNRQLKNQITQIEKLHHQFQHSISVFREAKCLEPAYTCYMYTFDLMDHSFLKNIACGSTEIYPRAEFIAFLISEFLDEVERNQAKEGDCIVYFDNERVVHAGKWQGSGIVISKWGKYSHLWRHGIYEVPIEYGNNVRFFTKLTKAEIENAYCQWAKKRLLN